jgi:hypothetical protein
MTRKDYVLIAESLQRSIQSNMEEFQGPVIDAAHAIATALASDNPRFNRETFLAACGV